MRDLTDEELAGIEAWANPPRSLTYAHCGTAVDTDKVAAAVAEIRRHRAVKEAVRLAEEEREALRVARIAIAEGCALQASEVSALCFVLDRLLAEPAAPARTVSAEQVQSAAEHIGGGPEERVRDLTLALADLGITVTTTCPPWCGTYEPTDMSSALDGDRRYATDACRNAGRCASKETKRCP